MIFERISSEELEADMGVSQVKKAEVLKMASSDFGKMNDDLKMEMFISVPEHFANQLEPYPRPETRRERRCPYKINKTMEPRTSAQNYIHKKVNELTEPRKKFEIKIRENKKSLVGCDA
ncbi:hypothetical protein CAEBREN_06871 [Caenorhabditis brenneri]|uniref:Uncharacterized protein n=1 Tax=Caenorhabditis brenneri TaxID=135651 RepID=G0MTH5_CAEBE|nr:hypothetical protein CAEBREN_06871 [Caenorhabditis brenneri]